MKMLFGITYVDDEGKEFFQEVPAYSEEQAKYLLGLDDKNIIDIECVVKKYATH